MRPIDEERFFEAKSEAKSDGFRAAAEMARGRLISRDRNRLPRFDAVLDLLAKGYVLDGELVVLDAAECLLLVQSGHSRMRPKWR